MNVETFLERLQRARYFEGYSNAAIQKAIKAIRKNHTTGMAGSHAADFARFPGLSLVVTDVDQEMTGRDDLKDVLRQFGRASFGIFTPQSIQIRRKAGEDRYRLEFTLKGKKRAMELEDDSWIPNAFFEQLDQVTTKHCSGLAFQAVEYPDSGQSGFYLWCTPRAYNALARAGLIPSRKNPLHAPSTPPPPDKPIKSQAAPAQNKTPELASPANPERAERLGLHRKGRWKIPRLSQKTLLGWKDLAASKATSAEGNDLNTQTCQTFDLLCAIHCGMTGIGSANDYARRVIELVDRYLFGAWRIGYIEEGVKLTAKTASKALYWSLPLQVGCAVAATVGDERNLNRFLEYVRGDVYDENLENELAYYRLLSDLVLGRSEWDWSEQADLIAECADDRFVQLLACLEALRADNETQFQKAIRKFGGKPKYSPPSWFRGVVDEDVTVLAELVRRKGWRSDEFSVHLQDRILDRRIFE